MCDEFLYTCMTVLFHDYLITELKSYYCECLPFITNQTRNHKDTAPSILEEIASEISAQLEWENEWNSQGLASRLSEQVYPYKLYRIFVMIKSGSCLASLASAWLNVSQSYLVTQ